MIKRVAVFGGAGFIGTNLVYQLIDSGCHVFNFDNLSGLGNLLNIAELMQQSRHSFARCDITNPEEIRQSLLMAAPDTIFLCITPKNLDSEDCLKPFGIFFDSLRSWFSGFAANKDIEFRKIVVVLSEFHKSQGKLGPVYEKFKTLVDKYVSEGLPILTLLSPITFGPFQQPDSPIPLIIYRAIEGETIPVINPESSSGDIIYVSDLVKAVLLADSNGKIGAHYQLIGAKPEITNLEAAEEICETLNELMPPPVGRYQALIDEIESNIPTSSGLVRDEQKLLELGDIQKNAIKTALRETVKWYLDNQRWYSQSKTRFFYLWQNPKDVLLFK